MEKYITKSFASSDLKRLDEQMNRFMNSVEITEVVSITSDTFTYYSTTMFKVTVVVKGIER